MSEKHNLHTIFDNGVKQRSTSLTRFCILIEEVMKEPLATFIHFWFLWWWLQTPVLNVEF